MGSINTSFAVITDTHYTAPSQERAAQLWNRQLISRSEELAERLIASLNAHRLDFVIHCGDVTDTGDEASFHFAREVFARINAPVYFTFGNHDPALPGGREVARRVFGRDSDRLYATHYLGGIRWIFLDSNFAQREGGEDSPLIDRSLRIPLREIGVSAEQIRWLQTELVRDQETVTFVVVHHPLASKAEYPVIAPRDRGEPHLRLGPVWQELFPNRYREVLSLLEGMSNVKVVFSGHWHISEIVRVNTLYHIKTPSLIEYPFEYRIIRATEEYLDISTHGIADVVLENASLVPEWHNQWVRGEPFDRARRIFLDDALIATKW